MGELKLYEHELSGNAYKVRLFLSLLGLPFTTERVDLFKGAGQHPDYLAISAMGQVPALVDGHHAIRDSQAILFYLARTRGNGRWLADDPLEQARTIAWLSFAANELANGPAALRIAARFNRPVNIEWATAVTQRAFKLMEATLACQRWLMPGDHPSIADVACFPYTALAHEGNVTLADYPAVIAWCDRVRRLPGFVGMEGI
jgi:glutathione S-transferase